MGNTLTGHQFLDAVLQRLNLEGVTTRERMTALATLTLIVRWIGWQSYACDRTGTELAAMLGMEKANMTRTLVLLERIGAIQRVKRGQMKVITITPKGAYIGA